MATRNWKKVVACPDKRLRRVLARSAGSDETTSFLQREYPDYFLLLTHRPDYLLTITELRILLDDLEHVQQLIVLGEELEVPVRLLSFRGDCIGEAREEPYSIKESPRKFYRCSKKKGDLLGHGSENQQIIASCVYEPTLMETLRDKDAVDKHEVLLFPLQSFLLEE